MKLIGRFTLETDNPSSKSVKIEGKPEKVRQILHPELRGLWYFAKRNETKRYFAKWYFAKRYFAKRLHKRQCA